MNKRQTSLLRNHSVLFVRQTVIPVCQRAFKMLLHGVIQWLSY